MWVRFPPFVPNGDDGDGDDDRRPWRAGPAAENPVEVAVEGSGHIPTRDRAGPARPRNACRGGADQVQYKATADAPSLWARAGEMPGIHHPSAETAAAQTTPAIVELATAETASVLAELAELEGQRLLRAKYCSAWGR